MRKIALIALLIVFASFYASAFPKGGIGLYTLVLPGSPLAVYSVLKYQGWAGECVRVQRSSDSAQLDIGFSQNNYIDMSEAKTFAGAGTLTVVTWYDQSGNSNDATSSGSPPILRSQNLLEGIQPITFVPPNGNPSSSFLTIPSSVVASTQSFTMYGALSLGGGLVNSLSYFSLGSGTIFQNEQVLYDNASSGQVRWLDSSFHTATYPQTGQASTMGLLSNTTTATMRVNGVPTTASAAASLTLTGGFIGKAPWTGAPLSLADIFAVVIYGSAVSTSDAIKIENNFSSDFNAILAPAKQITYDGDSITAGYNNAGYILNLPRQSYPILSLRAGAYNIGIAGETMAAIYASRGRASAHYNGSLLNNIDHIFAGTNDIAGAPSGSIVGVGTTTYNSYLLPYILAMQTTGFKVVVGTMLPRLWAGSPTDIAQREAERLVYNSLILSNAAANSYTVADYAGLYTSNPTAYTTGGGSVDGIHPTVATYGNMAVICAAAINSIL